MTSYAVHTSQHTALLYIVRYLVYPGQHQSVEVGRVTTVGCFPYQGADPEGQTSGPRPHQQPVTQQRDTLTRGLRSTLKYRPYSQSHRPYSQSHRQYSQSHRPYSQSHRQYSQSHRPYSQSHRPYNQSHRPYNQSHRPYSQSHRPYNQSHRPYNQSHRPYSQSHSSEIP